MPRHYATAAQIQYARDLRLNATEAEKRLWNLLRNRQLDGQKFKRQFPIGNYIVDFACEMQKLVIELDGGQHNNPLNQSSDVKRTADLEQIGWQVLRFWNHEILTNSEGVLLTIRQALTQNQLG